MHSTQALLPNLAHITKLTLHRPESNALTVLPRLSQVSYKVYKVGYKVLSVPYSLLAMHHHVTAAH